jgi:hypothetical protein
MNMNNRTQPALPPRDREVPVFSSSDADIVALHAKGHNHAYIYQALSEPPEEAFEKFTLFPNLPLELRLTVWRYTFPGSGMLCLDPPILPPHDKRSRHVIMRKLRIHEDTEELPISLNVSRESRRETLTKYHIVQRSESSWKEDIGHCLDPSTDRFYINFTVKSVIGQDLYD